MKEDVFTCGDIVIPEIFNCLCLLCHLVGTTHCQTKLNFCIYLLFIDHKNLVSSAMDRSRWTLVVSQSKDRTPISGARSIAVRALG